MNRNQKPLAYVRIIDKIKVPEQYHRGKKLLQNDRQEIRELYRSGLYTYRRLADLFGVSFATVQIIIDESRRIKNLEIAKKYRDNHADKIKENRKGKAMELRRYKKGLILTGKIELLDEGKICE